MSRLAIHPGPGTVIRRDDLLVWVGPSASPQLVSYLVSTTTASAGDAYPGAALCDQVAAVLRGSNPEPAVPFALVGPGPQGWVALLHGPVQLFDGVRWSVPQHNPGWMLLSLGEPTVLVVGPLGQSPPDPRSDPHSDLQVGVTHGTGFAFTQDAPSHVGGTDSSPSSATASAGPLSSPPHPPPPTDQAATGRTTPPGGTSTVGPASPAPTSSSAPATTPVPVTPPAPAATSQSAPPPVGEPVLVPRASPAPATESTPATPSASATGTSPSQRRVPLPAVSVLPRPQQAGPEVTGRRCGRGHFNHPSASACLYCGYEIPPSAPLASDRRPSLGVLLRSDGTVFTLDAGYVLGSNPAASPEASRTGSRIMRLTASDGAEVAAASAEIRLEDWDVVVADLGSPEGTFVLPPDSQRWSRLPPRSSRVLKAGSHIACGQWTVTYITPWGQLTRP